ncbi:MAG: peptidoglycan bridge formation glycyltransferase FemA/FemB family protein [Chloroflexota bacterium]
MTHAGLSEPDWDAFVDAAHPTSYLQRSAWAAAKAPNGWRAVRWFGGDSPGAPVEASGPNRVGAQVLIRRVRFTPWSIAYAPRGPLAQTWSDNTIAAFTRAARLKMAALPDRVAYLRIEPALDPDIDEHEAGERATWLASRLLAAGWRRAPAVQPTASRIVDLRVGEAALWSGLRKKWRQYVNRARADGVRVVDGDGDRLADFYAIYRETARRAGFIIRSEGSYRDVWTAFDREGLARLLFAELPDGTPVATLLLLRSGATVTEPFGGITVAGSEHRANYLLKWDAMNRSRDAGAETYDMWGLSSPGIAHFKAGFGGREVRYAGAWDLVLDPVGRSILEGARRARISVSRVQHGLDPRHRVSPDGTRPADDPDPGQPTGGGEDQRS